MSRNSSLFRQRRGALAVGIVFLLFSCGQLFGILWVWGKWGGAEGVQYSEVVKQDRFTSAIITERHILSNEALMLITVLVLAQLLFDAILLHGVRLSPTQSSSARCCIFAWLVFRALLFGIITVVAVALLQRAAFEDYYQTSIVKFVISTIGISMLWYGWAVEQSFYRRLRSADIGAASRDWELVELKVTTGEQAEKAPTEKRTEKDPTKAPQNEDPKEATVPGKA